MKKILVGITVSIFVLMSANLIFAQAPEAPNVSGVQAEVLRQLESAEQKFLALAETTPQEKYSWRPGEGVRSISEVFMHVAGANYFILGIAGIKPPEDLPKEMEKITDKAKVAEHLKRSFAFTKEKIAGMSEADLEKKVKLFGNDTVAREAILVTAVHAHEHLGQSIAYSRVNGIVPPWSASANNDNN